MNIISAYLQGGLGNQAFIYAAARALSLRTGAGLSFCGDYFLEDKVYRRSLSLDAFRCALGDVNVHCKLVRLAELARYRLLCDYISRLGNYCCDRRPFKFRPFPEEWRGTLTLDGYWQSERYFADVRREISADFTLRDASWLDQDPLAAKIRGAENPVFLHVRSYKDIPGKEDGSRALKNIIYYRNALDYLKGILPRATVFVFSDDVEWAKANVVRETPCFRFVYSNPDSSQLRDFMLMRLCQHSIAANSTYSWWASWLGEQEHGGIRIRLGKRVMNDDFWPERWISISREG